MEQQTCKDCYYYYQHYIKLTEDRYAAGCGHCIYPRLKTRSQFTKICENFRPREVSPKSEGETNI